LYYEGGDIGESDSVGGSGVGEDNIYKSSREEPVLASYYLSIDLGFSEA